MAQKSKTPEEIEKTKAYHRAYFLSHRKEAYARLAAARLRNRTDLLSAMEKRLKEKCHE